LYAVRALQGIILHMEEFQRSDLYRAHEHAYLHCVSKKTSSTFLAITRESIDGFL